MSFKIICNVCGNERELEDIFELLSDDKNIIEIGTNAYEEILVWCPKCNNKSKGKY